MIISPYQVNNVLRVYGDQLRNTKVSNRVKNNDTRSPDRIQISAEAKRMALVDKIASNIIERIIQDGPNDNVEKEVFKKLEDEYGAQLAISKKGPSEFLFKVIDEKGETINSLSIKDSKFLTHKLKDITRETVDKNIILGIGGWVNED